MAWGVLIRSATPPRLSRTRSRRPAFTLVELIVSVGVLALMMTMAGAVFHLTLRSTGQAKAVTSVTQRLRTFETALRADLSSVDPQRSIMVIVPARMNAYWTTVGRDADADGDPSNGYPHPEDPEREVHDETTGVHSLAVPRADRLMFVTARRGTSVVDPRISGSLQAVTYGHAVLGDWEDTDPQPDTYDWKWRPQAGEQDDQERRRRFDVATLVAGGSTPANPFPSPAEEWHLARRAVILAGYSTAVGPPVSSAVTQTLDDWTLVQGLQDVVAYPAAPDPYSPPPPFHYLDDMVFRLNHDPDYSANPPEFKIEDRPIWYARSELDFTPPAPIANRLGHYLLARCASFKVEFAMNLPELAGLGEVLWIDPADLVEGNGGSGAWDDPDLPEADWSPTRHRIERLMQRIRDGAFGEFDVDDPPAAYVLLEGLKWENGVLHFDSSDPDSVSRVGVSPATGGPMIRWYTAPPPPASMGMPDPLFPVALRVTVDVYDDEQRLERPTRHVMVFKVGG